MRGFREASRTAALVDIVLVGALLLAACGGQPGADDDPVQSATSIAPEATLPVYDDDRTDLDPGDPPEQLDEDLIDATLTSAVQVVGEGCTRLQLGSGFVVDEETVVTNAHVVAGVDELMVRTRTGAMSAELLGFDPEADIAVLRVEGLVLPALELTDGDVDDEGVLLGFGGSPATDNGTLAPPDPDPFRINRLIVATGENIYRDSGETRRDAYLIAAEIEPGDSGGALVRSDGAVVGMAFAASKRSNAAYAVRASEILSRLDNPEILGDTERCARG